MLCWYYIYDCIHVYAYSMRLVTFRPFFGVSMVFVCMYGCMWMGGWIGLDWMDGWCVVVVVVVVGCALCVMVI